MSYMYNYLNNLLMKINFCSCLPFNSLDDFEEDDNKSIEIVVDSNYL